MREVIRVFLADFDRRQRRLVGLMKGADTATTDAIAALNPAQKLTLEAASSPTRRSISKP